VQDRSLKMLSTRRFKRLLPLMLLLSQSITLSLANEWTGNLSAETRGFAEKATLTDQSQFYGSISLHPEYYHEWENGVQSLTASVFARKSFQNESRSHIDLRELYWTFVSEDWELRVGVRKIFWGVTESQHLVDIVNQTDFVESFDGEEKLGQPMVNLAWIQDWGTLDLFILTGFRQREFPSSDARLRTELVINSDEALYESDQEKSHIDFAIRYSHVLGDWDIGLSLFYGTSREPRFELVNAGSNVKLVPYYDIINQTGLDVQATLENWLWKAESIYRNGMGENYIATTFGLEYSFYDIASTGLDIGLVTEHLYDSRQSTATNAFENDLMLGLRFALNDTQSTEALAGIIQDIDGEATVLSLEANRRIGDQIKITLEGYLFSHTDNQDLLYSFRNDDYVQLELGYFF